MEEGKYRIVYTNLKSNKTFNIHCIDKVYQTIRNMEKKGQAEISFDERKILMSKMLGSEVE